MMVRIAPRNEIKVCLFGFFFLSFQETRGCSWRALTLIFPQYMPTQVLLSKYMRSEYK